MYSQPMPHKDPEERRAYAAAYARKQYATNPKRRAYQKESVGKNRDKARAATARWQAKNPSAWKKAHAALMSDPVRLEKKRAYARRQQKKYREANQQKVRDRKLKDAYGIGLEEYTCLLKKQKGKCAICRMAEHVLFRGQPYRLSVDHCHKTGKVRGLLCRSCNHGLGHFRDRPSLLVRAVEYLRRGR